MYGLTATFECPVHGVDSATKRLIDTTIKFISRHICLGRIRDEEDRFVPNFRAALSDHNS
ncbi:hypothetical protein DM48_7542 [Burkholderia gladioli]|uniref:Uncharacterized protein n=1 Tax=Burkholderia gladioli TaxID=28095 RepID=A0AAW3EY16_BURGA|nr:hypothetical protein DM48_7542 [Burkholderia gladioli]